MKLPDGVTDSSALFARRCLSIARAIDAAGTGEDVGAFAAPRVSALLVDEDPGPGAPDMVSIDPAATAPAILVPGLFGDSVRLMVAPFATSRAAMAREGYRTSVAWVNGRAGCDANAAVLRPIVLEAAAAAGEPVHLVGYSKGCTDSLHMFANHPDTRDAVRSLTSLAGVVHGTPLANDTARWLDAFVRWVPVPGAGVGDGRALDDLDPDFRRRHLERHPLPGGIRLASILASPPPDRISRVLRSSWRTLAAIDIDNDSQVTEQDALLPAGEFLGRLSVDHWAIALPIAERHPWLSWFVDQNDCPRGIVLRALIQHLSAPPAIVDSTTGSLSM